MDLNWNSKGWGVGGFKPTQNILGGGMGVFWNHTFKRKYGGRKSKDLLSFLQEFKELTILIGTKMPLRSTRTRECHGLLRAWHPLHVLPRLTLQLCPLLTICELCIIGDLILQQARVSLSIQI